MGANCVKEFLGKTDDVILADDGKSIKCLLRGKNPNLDNSRRSNSGHLKYFRLMHVCTAPVTTEKTRRIDEFYIPVEKQPRVGTPPNADNVEENTDLQSDTNNFLPQYSRRSD